MSGKGFERIDVSYYKRRKRRMLLRNPYFAFHYYLAKWRIARGR